MGDPLSDPRAKDLLSADPGEVWLLASIFRIVGGEAQSIAGALRGASHGVTWDGAAANAFRSTVGKLPGELEKVQASYGDVAGALDAYEGELAATKDAFQRLAQQLGSARSALGGAQGQLVGAQSNLSTALAAPHAKPNSPPVLSAHDAVQAATGAVSRLQGEVSGLESQGLALLGRFQDARDRCQGKVSSACSLAPHQSWWDHMLHDVGNWMSDAGHFVVGVAKGIYTGVTGLPGAIVDFVEHPSWKTFGTMMEDVAITASVVLLVTGVGEVFASGEGLAAAALDAGNDAAGAAAKGASYLAAGADGGQAANDAIHGDFRDAAGELSDGAINVAMMQAPELGDMLPASKAADQAAEAAGTLQEYADGKIVTGSAARTLLSMSPEDRQTVFESAGYDRETMGPMSSMSREQRLAYLQDIEHPEAMVEAAENKAYLLHIASLPAKVAVNFSVDKLINDPMSDWSQERVRQAIGAGG